MSSAAVFLAGSILYSLAGLVILIAIVVCNNIIHKHWKSFGWSLIPNWMNEPSPHFASQDELKKIAPILEEKK